MARKDCGTRQVELIDHYGSYMRFRIQRHNYSIGFLFKLIEELKDEGTFQILVVKLAFL